MASFLRLIRATIAPLPRGRFCAIMDGQNSFIIFSEKGMKRFGEQLIYHGETAQSPQTSERKYFPDVPTDFVDVGMKVFLKAHNLHGAGIDISGASVFESAANHSLHIDTESVIGVGMTDGIAVDILNKEREDFERADEILRKLASGEIGGSKKQQTSTGKRYTS